MMKVLLAAFAVLFAWAAPTSTLAGVSIVDGDTLKIDGRTIRIVEIDAPENYRSRCEHELVLALAAKQRLRELIDRGPVRYQATGTDRSGRTLAIVTAGGANVGEKLIREGHALRYRPGAAAKLARLRVWCGPDAQLDDKWSKAEPTAAQPSTTAASDAAKVRRGMDLILYGIKSATPAAGRAEAGSCMCPDDRDSHGRRCGKRAASHTGPAGTERPQSACSAAPGSKKL